MQTRTLQLKVRSKRIEAADVCSYELVDPEGSDLPPFSAGAHIDVHLPNGLVRQYSLCNPPSERSRYVIAVLRDASSRGGSIAMHDLVHEGDLLRISEPRNQFGLEPSADRALLLAGGIGITPIIAMAEHLAACNANFELHYCSRSRDRTAFHERILRSSFAGNASFHFDDGSADQRLDIAAVLGSADAGTHLYVCGPGGFLGFVQDAARSCGWPESRIHYEYFVPPAREASGDVAFDVQLASTGKVYRIAADKTIVAALAEHGVDIEVSCEQGICGTCLTGVLQGKPDHRDQFLTDAEHARNDQMTLCCSRAKGGLLVLDR